jgi:hypothetical protein
VDGSIAAGSNSYLQVNSLSYASLSTRQCISMRAPGAVTLPRENRAGARGGVLLEMLFGLDLAADFRSLRKSFFFTQPLFIGS